MGLRPYIDKLLLHNIAAALDVVLEEGTLDDQFESLLHCVDAHARYEGGDCGHDQENYTQYDTGVCQDKTFLWAMILLGIASVALFIAAWILQLPVFALAALVLLVVAFATVNSVTINTQKAQKSNKDTYDEGKKRIRHRNGSEPRQDIWYRFNRKDVKKILRQHKVTQSHQKLMIDSYQERKLEQVPAFAWRTDKTLHFLVLEGMQMNLRFPWIRSGYLL